MAKKNFWHVNLCYIWQPTIFDVAKLRAKLRVSWDPKLAKNIPTLLITMKNIDRWINTQDFSPESVYSRIFFPMQTQVKNFSF
jgi:hypothetical protein